MNEPEHVPVLLEETLQALKSRADTALYQAKESGRNQTFSDLLSSDADNLNLAAVSSS